MPVTRGQWKHGGSDREKTGPRPDVCTRRGAALSRGMSLGASSEPGSWRMEGSVRDTRSLAQTCALPFEVFTAELQQPAQEEK